jgi:hypothetical protein
VSGQNREARGRRRRDENWSGFMVAKQTIASATTVLFHAVVGNGQKRNSERMIQNPTATTARWAASERRASNASVMAAIPESSDVTRCAGRWGNRNADTESHAARTRFRARGRRTQEAISDGRRWSDMTADCSMQERCLRHHKRGPKSTRRLRVPRRSSRTTPRIWVAHSIRWAHPGQRRTVPMAWS